MFVVGTSGFINGRPVREHRPAAGSELLVHDGKRIVARHGPESVTGCGNGNFAMVVGTKKELDSEIARFGLVSGDSGAAAP